MSDLISRQAVLDKFKALCDACGEGEKYNGVMCRCCALDDGICIVEDAPDAEPERKKGEWVYDGIRGRFPACKCSICGHYENADWAILQGANFCSNCGADMRGE